MQHGKFIIESYKQTFSNSKILFWGFIYSLFGGGLSLIYFNVDYLERITNENEPLNDVFVGFPSIEQGYYYVVLFSIIGTIFILLSIYFGNIAHAALLHATDKISANRKKELTLQEGMDEGKKRWLSLLYMKFLISLPALALVIFVWLLIWLSNFGGSQSSELTSVSIILLCLIMIIFFPLTLLLVLIQSFGARYLVLSGKKAGESLSMGWHLVKTKFASVIFAAFIFSLLGFVVIVVVSIVLSPLSYLATMLLAAIIKSNDLVMFVIWGSIFGLSLGLLNSLISAPIQAYFNLYWTHIFKNLDSQKK